MARRYREADLFTLASVEEAFGNVYAEALASGLPIVGSNIGGIPELVEHGRNGLLVPPRDPLALAAAIHQLGENPTLRAEMGRRNRARRGSKPLVGPHRHPVPVALSRNPRARAGAFTSGRAALELLVSLAMGWWLASDACPVFRAERFASDTLRDLAHRRLGSLLETAARTGFYGERLASVGIDARSPLLRIDPYGVSGCSLRSGSQSSARPERRLSMAARSMPTGNRRAPPAPPESRSGCTTSAAPGRRSSIS